MKMGYFGKCKCVNSGKYRNSGKQNFGIGSDSKRNGNRDSRLAKMEFGKIIFEKYGDNNNTNSNVVKILEIKFKNYVNLHSFKATTFMIPIYVAFNVMYICVIHKKSYPVYLLISQPMFSMYNNTDHHLSKQIFPCPTVYANSIILV